MSIKAMNWAWEQPLKPTSKLVLMRLADYANGRGACDCSLTQLIRDVGVSRNTILKALDELEGRDGEGHNVWPVYISRSKNFRSNGGRAKNSYHLHMFREQTEDTCAPKMSETELGVSSPRSTSPVQTGELGKEHTSKQESPLTPQGGQSDLNDFFPEDVLIETLAGVTGQSIAMVRWAVPEYRKYEKARSGRRRSYAVAFEAWFKKSHERLATTWWAEETEMWSVETWDYRVFGNRAMATDFTPTPASVRRILERWNEDQLGPAPWHQGPWLMPAELRTRYQHLWAHLEQGEAA